MGYLKNDERWEQYKHGIYVMEECLITGFTKIRQAGKYNITVAKKNRVNLRAVAESALNQVEIELKIIAKLEESNSDWDNFKIMCDELYQVYCSYIKWYFFDDNQQLSLKGLEMVFTIFIDMWLLDTGLSERANLPMKNFVHQMLCYIEEYWDRLSDMPLYVNRDTANPILNEAKYKRVDQRYENDAWIKRHTKHHST